MAIRNVILPLALFLVRTASSHRSFAIHALVVLTIFMGVVSPASAQTSSQQYVYVFVPGPPTKRFFPPGVFPILFLVVLAVALLGASKNVGKFAAATKRLAWSTALAVVFLCTVIYAAGCGATGAPIATVPPPIVTPPGTSTITLSPTAMSSTGQPLLLQPVQLTLTVN